MEKNLIEQFHEQFQVKKVEAKQYSPLALAYMGDCVYDLLIKTMLVESGNRPVNDYHRIASSFVKASAQAHMIEVVWPMLSEEEIRIFKRGKNAKSYTKAKNATYYEYQTATGFEALIGFLYLEGRFQRIMDIVSFGLKEGKNEKESEDGETAIRERK